MKQRLPGLICLLAALVICITLSARANPIPSFVLRHEGELTALAEQALADPTGEHGFSGIKRVDVWTYRDIAFVEFTIGYFPGFTGCYYSPTDIPIPFQGVSGAALTPTASGWAWEYMGNHGTTAKITDGWYTFEAYV